MRCIAVLEKSDTVSPSAGGFRSKGRGKKSLPGSPLVTVITVVFNGKKHLEQTILSVLDQSYKNIEYIVVDGGSTDGTLDILIKYDDRIDYWVSEPDNGIYDAMNKGIGLAKGELIGIINSDDYYLDGAVEKIVAASIREPEAAVFHADLRFERTNGISETLHSKDNLERADAYRMPVNHPTVFVRSVCYRQYGVFNTKYRNAADYDLILRFLFEHNVKFRHMRETTAAMREGGASGNFNWATYHDALEILSKRNFPRRIKLRFRVLYLWLLFMQFSKRYKFAQQLSTLHYKWRLCGCKKKTT
jgi:glycosyltransferase involved in cell wall biosynthesis